MKVQEYMRQKLEKEKRLALERRLAKDEKEKEYERVLQRQQKLMESKTERNELEYRRQREEVEREFRRREKEAAIKKREKADEIAKARNVQLEEVVSIWNSAAQPFCANQTLEEFVQAKYNNTRVGQTFATPTLQAFW